MSKFNRNFLWIAGMVLLAAAVWYFSDIVTYILLAWALSMLGRPVMDFFLKKVRVGKFQIGATSAALLTILSFFLVLVGLVMVFVPGIVQQAQHLASVDYTALGQKLQPHFQYLDAQAHKIGLLKPDESLAVRTQELLSTWLKPTLLGDIFSGFLSAAGGVAVTLTAVTFILFFFLKDKNLFTDMLHSLVPTAEMEEKVLNAVDDSSKVLTAYFGGLLVQTLVFAACVSVILWVLGVPNALLIGAFGGLMNIVPYLGPIIGQVFGLFITLSSSIEMDFVLLWPLLLKVVAAFVVTQFLDNNFVGPMIFSKSVEAHPLEIFIVTLVAAKIGGVAGMVVAIPVYTVLRVIARTFFSEFKIVQRLWT